MKPNPQIFDCYKTVNTSKDDGRYNASIQQSASHVHLQNPCMGLVQSLLCPAVCWTELNRITPP